MESLVSGPTIVFQYILTQLWDLFHTVYVNCEGLYLIINVCFIVKVGLEEVLQEELLAMTVL